MINYNVLSRIDYPCDLKKLNNDDLVSLCDEIRRLLLYRITETGGHMGSNLGVVELTVALHYVFNAPLDKIVFDISHQTYIHKILTGRKSAFLDKDKYSSVSGYTNPRESEYDLFRIGHTSTSLSLACGLCKARELSGGTENVVAVIGDGSLSGGEALEGLNNASVVGGNMIIVINDNEMSIAENTGGIYKNLQVLRNSNGESANNIFTALGFEYYYEDSGNDVLKLIELFKSVKDSSKPVVVHVHTVKGLGCDWAERDKEAGHFASKKSLAPPPETDYKKVTAEYLENAIKKDETVFVVNAATPGVVGLTKKWREDNAKNYVDVGIAEEHAVAVVSGGAKGGAKPIMLVLSSFLQRTFDQLMQDLALNNNPATILVFGGGLSGADETHVGAFDVCLTGIVPNVDCLAPTNKNEYLKTLDYALSGNLKNSLIIRVPDGLPVTEETTAFSVENPTKNLVLSRGNKVAIIGLGSALEIAKETKKVLEKSGINATLINPVCYSKLDTATLDGLVNDHSVIVTVEDGVIYGGFGEKVARYFGKTNLKTLCYGGDKEFTDREPISSQLTRYRLKGELIAEDVLTLIGKNS